MADLLPCPFCGGMAKSVEGSVMCDGVGCPVICGVPAQGFKKYDPVAIWNTRAPDPVAAARITELEAERDNAKMDLMHIAESYRCADEERDEMRGRALAAESELSRVEGKVRETLSPFEEAVEGCIDDAAHDSWDIWESPAAMCITVGDLRRAAELLRSLPPLAKRGEQKETPLTKPESTQNI